MFNQEPRWWHFAHNIRENGAQVVQSDEKKRVATSILSKQADRVCAKLVLAKAAKPAYAIALDEKEPRNKAHRI